ncbi:MAG: TonB-dependent receptor [Chitinophagaceae bacterium]|nr:TonB-dependent receptor [Chitinophagaceae bacterium]
MNRIISLAFLFISISGRAQTGHIKGKITTADGRPVANVTVTILSLNRITMSQEDGYYSLRNIDTGIYTLTISCEGLQTVHKQVHIGADGSTPQDFSLLESAEQLNEVIVNARRTANDKPVAIGKSGIAAMDLPQAISIIEKGMLDNQQVQRLSDALRNVNGVYLASARGASQENISARGYGLGSANLFKDGARINSGAMPEMSSLERVEVLKGSAAILFGNLAPGGVINLVTKTPKFTPGAGLTLRSGSYGLFKPAVDLYGPVSSTIAYRINGSFEAAGSYRDQVHSERYYINPSLLFKPGKYTELIIQGDYLAHNFTPDFGIGSIANTSIPDVARAAFFGTPWQYAKTHQLGLNALLRHSINEQWNFSASASYQEYNRDYYSTERIQALANGDLARPLNRAKNMEDYYVAQVNITGKINTGKIKHTLLAGMDADKYYTTTYSYNQPTVYDTINILNPDKFKARTDIPAASETKMVTTPTIRFGIYAQDLLSLTDKWKLLLGVRWSVQDARPATTTDLVAGTATQSAAKTDKAFSPRAGLVYRATGNTSLFISYANSFTVNSGTDVFGNALSPSVIDQYEAGIKNDLFRGILTANMTVYRIVNNNLAQTALYLADGITPNSNTSLKALTGQTKSDGVEIDISANPLHGLSILAGYSYNFIRYTRTPDAKGNFIEGERLQNSVGSTANASVFCSRGSWKLGGSLHYTGPRYAGFNNTKGQAQNYNRLFEVSGFTVLDLSAGYTYKKLGLIAKISNLANTLNYYTHENYSINPIPPRQLVATLSYKF